MNLEFYQADSAAPQRIVKGSILSFGGHPKQLYPRRFVKSITQT
jgi:hypothetical protein